jgi:crossover junction endodeoxyribonuclease RusA
VLVLPYPISANRYWGERVVPAAKGRPAFVQRYITPEAREYRETVAKMARAAGVASPFPGRVFVGLQLYPHRPQDWATRMRKLGDAWDDTVQCIDLDNARKVLLDALNGVSFIDDDRIWKDEGERMEPDGEARVVVTVRPIVRHVRQLQLLEPAT